jgi:ribosomal protein S18 acetylase RimI-like enzyme
MLGMLEVAAICGGNLDEALALLHTVVPPRPSLRDGLLAPGGGGFVVREAGRPVLAVGATTVPGDAPLTWIRVASARPRDTQRWLEAVPLAAPSLCGSPHAVECTVAAWDHGATERLVAQGLRAAGRTCYMASRERHALPDADLVPPSDAVIEACGAIDRAVELRSDELRSSEPAPTSHDPGAFVETAARFAERGDLFAFRIDGEVRAYLLLDDNTIDTLAVSPEVQGRGIGSMIVRFACATLQRRGHELVSLLTGLSNIEAIRLYERHGFRMHCINQWFLRALPATATSLLVAG